MDEAQTHAWLMEGDPAIRWQTLRYLDDAPARQWRAEQDRIGREGWGVRLLGHRAPDGTWTPKLYGKKWISTTYSLVLLRRLGLPRADALVRSACVSFLERQRPDGGIDISVTKGVSETCVTGMALALFSWFRIDDPRTTGVIEYLLEQQMPDGGWNCLRYQGAGHSSFHTTINVLEGLAEYSGEHAGETEEAAVAGREFLATHRMFRSHRTGAVVDAKMTRLSFPPRWRYDVLRGLEHFAHAGAPTDTRLEEAVEVVLSKRRSDGRWPLQQRHSGAAWFEMEEVGGPSRWNTLRALRVLTWWADR